MMLFRKKPVVIEAIRWTGTNLREIINFTGRHQSIVHWKWEAYEDLVEKEGLKIFTLEGPLMASVGDWIIKGVRGEFYPCKPDIFAATYEAATAAPATCNEPLQVRTVNDPLTVAPSQAAADVLAERRITPSWWRPTDEMREAITEYRAIKADYDAFDGDRRGIGSALVAARSRIVAALLLNVDGDDDADDDYHLVRACADLILAEIERLDRAAQAEREG